MSALLTTSDLAPLLGVTPRTVRNMVLRGEFPTSCLVFVGRSKHQKPVRFLRAKLVEAGWLAADRAVTP